MQTVLKENVYVSKVTMETDIINVNVSFCMI
jgi:hypothetical protein